jgi:hypothetical protein
VSQVTGPDGKLTFWKEKGLIKTGAVTPEEAAAVLAKKILLGQKNHIQRRKKKIEVGGIVVSIEYLERKVVQHAPGPDTIGFVNKIDHYPQRMYKKWLATKVRKGV